MCAVAAAGHATDGHAQCQYEVTVIQQSTDCDPLPASPTLARGINEGGQVVGAYTLCAVGGGYAFLWDGQINTLLGGASALDINDAGLIVGSMNVSGVGTRAYLYQEGQVIDLGTLPGGNFSRGRAINATSQVVGTWGNSVAGDPPLAAFVWQDGVMNDLNVQFGSSQSEALDINDQGQVTGWMGLSMVNGGQAFIWQEGQITELGHLPDATYGVGYSINEKGQVVGCERIGPFPGLGFRAFLWSDGEMIDIGLLPGFARSTAGAINDVGQIVGTGYEVGGNTNIRAAFIWQNGRMSNLNELVPSDTTVDLDVAVAINNAGQITGWGTADDTMTAAGFLLTPINQPLGDLDNDCTVGLSDFDMLIEAWGPCPGACPPSCAADLDGDCDVGIVDFLALLANWG